MKKIQGLALGSVLCLALAGLAMASEAEAYTVGDFAVNLAKMVTNQTDLTPEEARAYLEELGVDLKGDLGSSVEEAEFVDALNRFGLSLTTGSPEQPVSGTKAGRVFRMFDRNDTLFSGEVIKTCLKKDPNQDVQVGQCFTDADCVEGHRCKVVQSIKCEGGMYAGQLCESDGDCPGGFCRIPPGQLKRLKVASPSD